MKSGSSNRDSNHGNELRNIEGDYQMMNVNSNDNSEEDERQNTNSRGVTGQNSTVNILQPVSKNNLNSGGVNLGPSNVTLMTELNDGSDVDLTQINVVG